MAKQERRNSVKIRTEPRAGATWIALAGNLDEGADFSSVKQLPGSLVLDLGEIGRVNSLGVRNWIHFVRDYEAAGAALTFERCAPMMVQQMSMITNFMGTRSHVKSLLAPYVCMSCHHELLDLVEIAQGAPIAVQQTRPCPKCNATMELDELLETYTKLFQKPKRA